MRQSTAVIKSKGLAAPHISSVGKREGMKSIAQYHLHKLKDII